MTLVKELPIDGESSKINPMACKIYALCSSENGEIRYIGQTVNSIRRRLQQHLRCAVDGGQWPLCKWIRKTLSRGYTISIIVLIENAVLNETEAKLIAGYRANRARLLNVTDGGVGFVGWKPNADARRKMSAAAKRRASTPEGLEACRRGGFASRKHPVKFRRTRSEAAKAWAENNPERFAKFLASNPKARTATQKAKISASVKALWKESSYRAQTTASATKSWTPEKREAARQRGLKHKRQFWRKKEEELA
jgi:hypothetical protein